MAQSNLIHADILSGAYELALRTAHWQGDQALSASGVDTWYALDVDVLNFYSNPKEHARYAALTGLLPELQRNAVNPALLGLAEMLGRFLFKDSERPNLLMDACAEEFLDIYEIVSRKYFAELSTTARNVPHALTVLQKLVATYLKARSESPRSFVAKVAAQLAETLPALYGQYNATREIERWAPLIAAASERLIPASRLDAMAEALDARFEADCKPQGLGWTEIQLHWQQAIEKTFPVGATAADLKKGAVDANAMAEVEWINRYFHHLNRPVRLVYVSGASRLFDASLLRFNAIKDHRLPPPPIGMIEQLTITRYFAMVEPVGQSSQSEALDPNWAPLRDIRCFLADPAFVDFVRFATPESSDAETAPTPPMEADLTKWLNVFLSGTADQHPAASEGYLVLHGLKVAKRLAKPQYSNESTSRLASQFPAAAYEELNRNWQKFAARVGAAHGIERGYRHKVVEDIVKVFQGQDAIAVLSAALDQEMSDVLVNVGNASLAGESAGVRAQGTPPLVLSRFSAVEALICDTISDNSDQKKLADRIVENLKNQSVLILDVARQFSIASACDGIISSLHVLNTRSSGRST